MAYQYRRRFSVHHIDLTGMTEPKVVSGPDVEPVGLEEAKIHCKVDLDIEDELILGYIEAARDYYEWRTGRTLHEKTLEMVYDRFPGGSRKLILPRATPLLSVEFVRFTDSDGVEHTWDDTLYRLDADNLPGGIVPASGESYPSFRPAPVTPIRIRYRAGIEAASPPATVPGKVRYPILLLVGGMYESREAFIYDRGSIQGISIKYGVESFIRRAIVEYEF